LYILYHSGTQNLKDQLTKRFSDIVAREASYKFDPINNDADFRILTDEVNEVK